MEFKTLSKTSPKVNRYIQVAVLMLIFSSCTPKKAMVVKNDPDWIKKNTTMTKHYDEVSKTTYYLTRVNHKDINGKLIKLHMEISDKPVGETTQNFAIKRNAEVAINGSTGLNLPDNLKQPAGIQIIDGVIIQELKRNAYSLGIKKDNELVAYPPGTTAKKMLEDGSTSALAGFVPLILDHKFVSDKVLSVGSNSFEIHPRQVIAQFDNKDILFLSCGGRGYDGAGMTANNLMRILKDLDVRFGFNLDGGGSVSTAIGKQNINKKIDGKGTLERLRPNFLYVKQE